MLLGDGRLEQLRSEIGTVRAAQFRRLLDQCSFYGDRQPPAEHPNASITYLGPASAGFALAHRLTDQPHYLAEARRWIGGAVALPHWGRAHLPDHDLDAGWILHGLSLSYAWLRGRLPADEERALRDKLALQADRLHTYAAETEGTWWSSSYWQNHNWICYAGLLAAGYALADEHPDAPMWTKRAVANFETVADMLPADGSDSEGVVYWRYGVPWLAVAFELVAAAGGPDLFGRCAFLRETFWYRLHQSAPGWERIVDHGDCHDRRSGHSLALYHKLAAVYRIPQAQWLAERVREHFLGQEQYESGVKPGVAAEGYLELLWYDPTVPAEPPDPLPTTAYFPDLGLLAARTGWDADATLLSLKAAPGGGHRGWETSHRVAAERGWDILSAGHHHPDAGSFELIGHGAYLAVEDGYANQKQTANHNLVLVDGVGYAGDGRYHVYKGLPLDHQAWLRDVVVEAGWAHAVADASAMYPAELGVRSATRRVLFSPTGAVLLLDELAASEPRTWTWLLHTDRAAEPLEDGRLLVRSGPGALLVHPLTGGRVAPGRTPVVANPTASTPDLTVERNLHTLRVERGPAAATSFHTLLVPGSALAPVPATDVATGAGSVGWRHVGWTARVSVEGSAVTAVARDPAGREHRLEVRP